MIRGLPDAVQVPPPPPPPPAADGRGRPTQTVLLAVYRPDGAQGAIFGIWDTCGVRAVYRCVSGRRLYTDYVCDVTDRGDISHDVSVPCDTCLGVIWIVEFDGGINIWI